MTTECNGWKNYETCNVALWMQNDEGLYAFAKYYRFKGYLAFVECLCGMFGEESKLAVSTPDGILWKNSQLDIPALDEMMREL